jgi:hypothetical protein
VSVLSTQIDSFRLGTKHIFRLIFNSDHFFASFIFLFYHFQADPDRTVAIAKHQQIESVKIMVLCAKKYDFMEMTEISRDNILSSGPARFQALSAFHPSITSRQSHCFGTKLSTSFPSALFDTLVKLEVVFSHMSNFYHTDQQVKKKTLEIHAFCRSLVNIYQVMIFLFCVFVHFIRIF